MERSQRHNPRGYADAGEQEMANMMVGYGERVITPPIGVELCGYGPYLERKAESVLDALKVRTLFLKRGEESVVIAVCDLIGFSVASSDRLRGDIARESGLESSSVLLACTHTHSGPVTVPLRGYRGVDERYLEEVAHAVSSAVRSAREDLRKSEVFFGSEFIEPIGFNRRNRRFAPIDPLLRVVLFEREKGRIYLLNYACHAVTLGPSVEVSADWPGAVVRELESERDRCLVLQGFCGDIDPVTNRNRWGKGTKDDLEFYGRLLAQRAVKALNYATKLEDTNLRAVEIRVDLPLLVPSAEEIEQEKEKVLRNPNFEERHRKYIREWADEARRRLPELSSSPYMKGIPIQCLSLGSVRFIALPGEVFCEYALRLGKKCPQLIAVGYANGNIGYIPTWEAYGFEGDYACYVAPKGYALFPFRPDLEAIILDSSADLLGTLDGESKSTNAGRA